jgi:AraC-like DNA-binding protein
MSGRLYQIIDWNALASQAGYRASRMAALCLISTRQLERYFVRHFQKQPRQWLNDLRCDRARELLSSGYSNKAVAKELNFVSDAHFCRAFKKMFGAPPQTFAPSRASMSRRKILATIQR